MACSAENAQRTQEQSLKFLEKADHWCCSQRSDVLNIFPVFEHIGQHRRVRKAWLQLSSQLASCFSWLVMPRHGSGCFNIHEYPHLHSRAAFYEIFDTTKSELLEKFEVEGVNRVLDGVLLQRCEHLAECLSKLDGAIPVAALVHSIDVWEATTAFPSATCELKCGPFNTALATVAERIGGDSLHLTASACKQPENGHWQTATELFLAPVCAVQFSVMQLLGAVRSGASACSEASCSMQTHSIVCPKSADHTRRANTRWVSLLRKGRKLLRRTDPSALGLSSLQGVVLLLICCPLAVQRDKPELVEQVRDEAQRATAARSPQPLASGHTLTLRSQQPLSAGELHCLLRWMAEGREGEPGAAATKAQQTATVTQVKQLLGDRGHTATPAAAAGASAGVAATAAGSVVKAGGQPAVYTRKPVHAAHLAVKQTPSVASYGADTMWSGRGGSGFALKGLSALAGLASAPTGSVPQPSSGSASRQRSSSVSTMKESQESQGARPARKRSASEACVASPSQRAAPAASAAVPPAAKAVPATVPETVMESADGSDADASSGDQRLDTDGSDDGATLSADESQVALTPVASPATSNVVDLTMSDSSSDSEGQTLQVLSRKAAAAAPPTAAPGVPQPALPTAAGLSTSHQSLTSRVPKTAFDAPNSQDATTAGAVGKQEPALSTVSPLQAEDSMSVASDCFSAASPEAGEARSPPPDSQAIRALPPSPVVHGQGASSVALDDVPVAQLGPAQAFLQQPAVSKETQHRIWPSQPPKEVLESVSPPLISGGSRSLRVSPTPFLSRVLATTLSWVLADVKAASLSGDVKKPWWRWLGTPTNLHKELPPLPAPVAFQSMQHYAGYMYTMALEEVRAAAASTVERAGRLLRPAAKWAHFPNAEAAAGATQSKALCDPRSVAGNTAMACRVMAVSPSKRGGGVDISVQTVQARPKQGVQSSETHHARHFFTGLANDTNADHFSGVWGGRGITTRGLSSKNVAQNDMLLLVRWRPTSPTDTTVVAEYMVGVVNLNALECTNEISHAERGRWRGQQRGRRLDSGAPLLADSATRWGNAKAASSSVSASQVAYDAEQRALREEAASIDSSTLVPVTVTFKGAAAALREYFATHPPKTQPQKDAITNYVQRGQLVLSESLPSAEAGPFWPAAANAVTAMSTWLMVPLTSTTTALREYTGIMTSAYSCASALLEAPVPSRCSSQFGVVASVDAGWWKQAYAAEEERAANPPEMLSDEEVLKPTVAAVYTDRPQQVPLALYRRLQASFNPPQLAAILAIARGGAVFQPYTGSTGSFGSVQGSTQSRLPPAARSSAASASGGLLVVPGRAFGSKSSSGSGKSVHQDPEPRGMGNWGSQGSAGDPSLSVSGLDLTLIQGPPGTGKTTCIRGLVSVALSAPPSAVPVARPLKQKVGAHMLPGATVLEAAAHRPRDPRTVPGGAAAPFRNAAAALAADSAARPPPRPSVAAAKGVFGGGARAGGESEDPYAPPSTGAAAAAAKPAPPAATVGTSAPPPSSGVPSVTPIPHLKRVLICAPSNAAVDQVVARIVGVHVAGDDKAGQSTASASGLWDANGALYTPSIVRLGYSTTVAPELAEFTLESQVQALLRSSAASGGGQGRGGKGARGGAAITALVASESDVRSIQQRLDTATNLLRTIKSDLDKATSQLQFAEAHAEASSSAGRRGPHPQSVQARQRVTALKQQMSQQRQSQQRLKQQLHAARQAASSGRRGQEPAGNQKQHKFSKKQLEDAKEKVLSGAQIIACTLSGASSVDLATLGGRGFDLLIVDEACQACETSTLLPFVHRVRRAVLVGDPVQLPPTVISRAAESAFSRSLFERCVAGGMAVQQLRLQFRMHPGIREFPSNEFYGGVLQDGFSTPACPIPRSFIQPYHQYATFKPITFVDCSPRHLRQLYGDAGHVADIGSYTAKTSSSSSVNPVEAQLVVALFELLLRQSLYGGKATASSGAAGSGLDMRGRVGVITPYKHQERLIMDGLRSSLNDKLLRQVRVSTVDSFQGQEQDVIVISCVRSGTGERGGSSHAGGIGFLNDYRRMNVALTRAKYAVVVVGDATWLSRYGKHWRSFVQHCKEGGQFVSATPSLEAAGTNAFRKALSIAKQHANVSAPTDVAHTQPVLTVHRPGANGTDDMSAFRRVLTTGRYPLWAIKPGKGAAHQQTETSFRAAARRGTAHASSGSASDASSASGKRARVREQRGPDSRRSAKRGRP